MDKDLADKLFFTKEAADYLGISAQRLNALVKEGKITPLKRSNSATLFHIDELKNRKEESNLFKDVDKQIGDGTFKFDHPNKIEALNFSTLMNALKITESKLEPLFEEFSNQMDVRIFLDQGPILSHYASFFKLDEFSLEKQYKKAKEAFLSLQKDDEVLKRGDRDYPPLLLETNEAPRFLYIRGNKSLLFEKRTVALVGSRTASDESKAVTKRIARALGKHGTVIVSGLAKGIDVTAHREALDNGIHTIAVIGTNLNQYYPSENKRVQLEIEKKGLVISQFSPATKTERWFFPMRNGVMSGLSLATVILEAGETSGALKQADYAFKQGRLVLIPHYALKDTSITWPEKYLSRGAKVVTNVTEILRSL